MADVILHHNTVVVVFLGHNSAKDILMFSIQRWLRSSSRNSDISTILQLHLGAGKAPRASHSTSILPLGSLIILIVGFGHAPVNIKYQLFFLFTCSSSSGR
ncbi:hypothetical protein XENORESO_013820 [Xenotaenia resolanae]|uniref:Uncharacterized protein n=1 Tax=Xenotaenia resolanae TaxID=208358 RepID=A0ABV0WT27_9TELE